MNTYMLAFTSNTGVITRQEILDYLDTRREVLNWFAAMPLTIILVSRESSTTISNLLSEKFGNDITFIVSTIEPHTTNGYINKEVWDFINNPKSSGKWE